MAQRIQAVVEVEAHDDRLVRIMVNSLLERLGNSPRIDNPDVTANLYLVADFGRTDRASSSLTFTFDLFAGPAPLELAYHLVDDICRRVGTEHQIAVHPVRQCFHVIQAIAA